jgi:hypothetical protein
VGCGDGTWLAEFRKHGILDILGLDGHYVDSRSLKIPTSQFVPLDLSSPFRFPRAFDLAISLEVAEHLPVASAAKFIESLTELAPAILFSAAIPFQGGSSHLNEQWPEYWASLFSRHGYLLTDCIRPSIWDNDNVEWWYRQNCFLYATDSLVKGHGALYTEYRKTNYHQLRLVHPRQYLQANKPAQPGVRQALKMLAGALNNASLGRLTRGNHRKSGRGPTD